MWLTFNAVVVVTLFLFFVLLLLLLILLNGCEWIHLSPNFIAPMQQRQQQQQTMAAIDSCCWYVAQVQQATLMQECKCAIKNWMIAIYCMEEGKTTSQITHSNSPQIQSDRCNVDLGVACNITTTARCCSRISLVIVLANSRRWSMRIIYTYKMRVCNIFKR